MNGLRIRRARPADAPAMGALLGVHVRHGGRTALSSAPGPGALATMWLTGPCALLCQLAEDGTGLIGFQAVSRYPGLPAGWGDMATFVREGDARRGVGRRLFAETLARAPRSGLGWLVAVVRPENTPALAFYAAIGFQPWRVLPDGRHALRRSARP